MKGEKITLLLTAQEHRDLVALGVALDCVVNDTASDTLNVDLERTVRQAIKGVNKAFGVAEIKKEQWDDYRFWRKVKRIVALDLKASELRAEKLEKKRRNLESELRKKLDRIKAQYTEKLKAVHGPDYEPNFV